MNRNLIIQPRAQAELREQAQYVAGGDPKRLDRFLDAADRTFADLVAMPGMGHRAILGNRRLAETRSWRIKGFENWLVFYRVTDQAVEILRVLHGARDLEELFESGSERDEE